jgi:hypothetical protein
MAVTVTVPPSTTKLIALAALKAILAISDSANDALLGNIIQRGSDKIARFCNRVFAQRTVQETLPGPGGQLLKLKFSPIVTLISIALDGETVDSDTYTLTEPDAGIVFCVDVWASGDYRDRQGLTDDLAGASDARGRCLADGTSIRHASESQDPQGFPEPLGADPEIGTLYRSSCTS